MVKYLPNIHRTLGSTPPPGRRDGERGQSSYQGEEINTLAVEDTAITTHTRKAGRQIKSSRVPHL